MEKSELKKILKPLIKECVKEVIFEDGVLSGLITEVARGLSNVQPVATAIRKPQKTNNESTIRAREQLNEVKQQMQKASGLEGIFEGMSPPPQATKQNSQHGPLRDVNPTDAGVNIDGLVKLTGGWNQIK